MFSTQWKDSERLIVRLEWDWPCDLDLSAVTVDWDGKERLVYHGNKGALSRAPFIRLEGDADEGLRKKFRAEQITITRLYPDEVVYLAFWDHNAVMEGRAAEICSKASGYRLTITDEYNRLVEISVADFERSSNGRVLCRIERTPHGFVVIQEKAKDLRLSKEALPLEQISLAIRENDNVAQQHAV